MAAVLWPALAARAVCLGGCGNAEATVSEKTPSTLPSPIADTTRRISDAFLFVLGFPLLGLAWEIYIRRGNSRFLLMLAIGLVATGVLFLSGRVVVRVGMEVLEKIAQRDFNGDGTIAGERLILVNKPVRDDRARWHDFVQQVAIDSTVPRLMACGFTRTEIEIGRQALIDRGLAEWHNSEHRQGWSLTKTPGAVLASLPLYPLDDNDRTV
jgi:hypothetical protein